MFELSLLFHGLAHLGTFRHSFAQFYSKIISTRAAVSISYIGNSAMVYVYIVYTVRVPVNICIGYTVHVVCPLCFTCVGTALIKMLENDGEEAKHKSFYWKGKKVSEKVYNQRRKQQELGKNVRSIYGTKKVTANLKQTVDPNEDTEIEKCTVEGRRIVHIDTLAQQMFCEKCKSKLHFTDVEGEKQYGLASIFYIRCEKCKVLCSVATDKQHRTT